MHKKFELAVNYQKKRRKRKQYNDCEKDWKNSPETTDPNIQN
jgi:hypothetical protein